MTILMAAHKRADCTVRQLGDTLIITAPDGEQTTGRAGEEIRFRDGTVVMDGGVLVWADEPPRIDAGPAPEEARIAKIEKRWPGLIAALLEGAE